MWLAEFFFAGTCSWTHVPDKAASECIDGNFISYYKNENEWIAYVQLAVLSTVGKAQVQNM